MRATSASRAEAPPSPAAGRADHRGARRPAPEWRSFGVFLQTLFNYVSFYWTNLAVMLSTANIEERREKLRVGLGKGSQSSRVCC